MGEMIMESQNGTVTLSGFKLNRSILRHLEKRIEQWVEREQSLLFLPKVWNYSVQIDRGYTQPFYSCWMKICIGSREWKSHESGHTLEDVLLRALNHLRIIPQWTFTTGLTFKAFHEPSLESG